MQPCRGGRHGPRYACGLAGHQVMTLEYRPNDPEVLSNPFALYARMRDEDPAHWSPLLKAWVLTRYEDVKRTCLDTAGRASDRPPPFFVAAAGYECARGPGLMHYPTPGPGVCRPP